MKHAILKSLFPLSVQRYQFTVYTKSFARMFDRLLATKKPYATQFVVVQSYGQIVN
jgi:hypothetical protein